MCVVNIIISPYPSLNYKQWMMNPALHYYDSATCQHAITTRSKSNAPIPSILVQLEKHLLIYLGFLVSLPNASLSFSNLPLPTLTQQRQKKKQKLIPFCLARALQDAEQPDMAEESFDLRPPIVPSLCFGFPWFWVFLPLPFFLCFIFAVFLVRQRWCECEPPFIIYAIITYDWY